MRLILCSLLLCSWALPATAVTRVELSAGRAEGPGWVAKALQADWDLEQGIKVSVGQVSQLHPLLEPLQLHVACSRLESREDLSCRGGTLIVRSAESLSATASFELRLRTLDHWQLKLRKASAQVSYNSTDGRIAADRLQMTASGHLTRADSVLNGSVHLDSAAGQAYLEPVFMDFSQQPAALTADAVWPGGARPVELNASWSQPTLGNLQLRGTAMPTAPTAQHQLQLELRQGRLAPLTETLLVPLLAGTRFGDLNASGTVEGAVALHNGQPQTASLRINDARIGSDQLGMQLRGLAGEAYWAAGGEAAPSQLQWSDGTVGALPLGASQLRFIALPQGVRLTAPLRLPVLDGALNVRSLELDGLGGSNPSADFNAELEPLDLALLGRSLGWPAFGGRLSGRLPGLRLRDRELSLDGTLSAQVFDGEITVSGLRVLDPFGVLPRVRGDLTLRRLDLEAMTGAFAFGRITGRLDGEVTGLRLLGWRPVAMKAKLYSTPGDKTRKRISQRAIDNISSIGGGPTGLLSRGALSLFEDFAYARMGWSCVLENGICTMAGVGPAARGTGYILVEGRLLPRIDVIGHSRRVDWDVFIRQLASVRGAEGVEVR